MSDSSFGNVMENIADSGSNKHMWYIVQVYSGFEKAIIDHVKNIANLEGVSGDFEEFNCPSVEEEVLVNNSVKKKPKAVYPGYIFIKMNMNQKSWGIVSGSHRVMGFVGSDKFSPRPISDSEYEKMIKDISNPIADSSVFEVSCGDTVKIKNGSFESLTGTVNSVDNDRKIVNITLMIFDRETSLELEWSQIEKVK